MSYVCPVCLGKASCLESRVNPDGDIRRRYRCRNDLCGTKFYSREAIYNIDGESVISSEAKKMKARLVDALQKTMDALKGDE